MREVIYFNTIIPQALAGLRLDKVLVELLPDYSRARLQKWIMDGYVRVNTKTLRGKDKVQGGEYLEVAATLEEETEWTAQALPLTVLYEDADIIVINKPAGLVVHPGAGNAEFTLVNALLHHAPELAQLPRAGIVHRLDKETSGILVVARSLSAHTALIVQQQARKFLREYQAIVIGILVTGGTIDAPIARHPTQRTQMAVIANGRPAITHYRIIQRFREHTHIRVQLETGRTHQIRVHFAYKRYPLLGDPVYGGRLHLPPGSSEIFRETLRSFSRQALHAEKLGITHPRTGEFMQWQAPLPPDMQNMLAALAVDSHH
ncbi:MAG: 23S rRNA pseudouridine(1911/1915/1917) synthase [Beggiatoa sp. IS2]|nr:MAG: 23S rRNA pseudouridine(1911/1915/1917) synthase [Beggiatoa sp. IS2]